MDLDGHEDLLITNEKGLYGGLKMANGTNPMRSSPGMPGTRAKSAAMVRDLFIKAQAYKAKTDKASAGLQPLFKDRTLWKRSILGYLNGDLTFALLMSRYPQNRAEPSQLPFFLGMSLTNWTIWQTGSLVGIFLAGAVPDAWGLGFAGTLALIAILLPMLDGLSMRLAALTALVVALAANDLPYKLSIVLAVLAAIAVGIASDRLIRQRKRVS